MDVDSRLDEAFTNGSGTGPGYETPGRGFEGFVNYGTKLEKVFILQFLLSLVVQVDEKLEPFGLLLDDVQFPT
jgi:hypothetical protein